MVGTLWEGKEATAVAAVAALPNDEGGFSDSGGEKKKRLIIRRGGGQRAEGWAVSVQPGSVVLQALLPLCHLSSWPIRLLRLEYKSHPFVPELLHKASYITGPKHAPMHARRLRCRKQQEKQQQPEKKKNLYIQVQHFAEIHVQSSGVAV